MLICILRELMELLTILKWQREYLISLREHHKNKHIRNSQVEIKPNDVVLLNDDNLNRIKWKLGRVVELLPGKDKKVRVVKLKTANGETLRSINKCYPLESCVTDLSENHDLNSSLSASKVNAGTYDSNVDTIDSEVTENTVDSFRPERRSAVKFRKELKALIENDCI